MRRMCSRVRDAAGQVNLLLAAETPSGGAGAGGARAAADHRGERAPSVRQQATAAGRRRRRRAAAAAEPPRRRAGRRRLAALSIRAGQLDWRDATTSPQAALAARRLLLRRPGDRLAARGAGRLQGRRASLGAGEDQRQARVLRPGQRRRREGRGRARRRCRWSRRGPTCAACSAAARRRSSAPTSTLDWKRRRRRAAAARRRAGGSRSPSSLLGDAKAPELAAEQVELLDARIDTVARSAAIGSCALQAPRLRLERDADGRWNVATLASAVARLVAPRPPARARPRRVAQPAASAPARRRPASAARLGSSGDRQGPGRLHRPRLAVPAALDLPTSPLQAQGLALDGAAAAPFQSADAGRGAGGPERPGGRRRRRRQRRRARRAEGHRRRRAAERAARRSLLKDLPLHLLDPYLDDLAQPRRAEGADQLQGHARAGQRAAAGPRLALRGDATIDDFRASQPARRADGAAARPGDGPRSRRPARRCSTGSRCRCAASTSRSPRARGRA